MQEEQATDVNDEPEEVYGYVPNVERLPRSQVNEAAVLQVYVLSLIVCCMNGSDVSAAAGALLPELPFAQRVNEPVHPEKIPLEIPVPGKEQLSPFWARAIQFYKLK